MKRARMPFIAFGFVLLSLIGFSADIPAQENSHGIIDQIKNRGVLRVGLSHFMPRAMADKHGRLIGFDVDVANKIAEDLGVKAELVLTPWDGIVPSLLLGRCDIIISGMIITPARNLSVNFTIPYITDGVALAANKKLAAGFRLTEDFNQPGVKLTVRKGAAPYIDLIRKTFPKAAMLEFDDDELALQEVLAGRAHAVLSGEPRPIFWCMDHPDSLFEPLSTPLAVNLRAFALRKGDVDSLNFFNNWIMVRTQDGWLKDRQDYWFKSRQWADSVPKS